MPQWSKSRIASIPAVAYYNDFKLDNTNLNLLDPNNVIVLDTETTGLLSTSIDEIIQVGLCLNQDLAKTLPLKLFTKTYNNEKGRLEGYEMPTKPIWNKKDETIEKFRNVVKLDFNLQKSLIEKAFNQGYKVPEFIDDLANILNNKVVIMHNGINFDANFLNKLFGAFNKKVNYACLDTMSLTYHLNLTPTTYNGNASYTQESVGRYLQVTNLQAHNAVYDCVQLFGIYNKLYEKYKDDIINVIKNSYSINTLIDGISLNTTIINNQKTTQSQTVFETPLKEQIANAKKNS